MSIRSKHLAAFAAATLLAACGGGSDTMETATPAGTAGALRAQAQALRDAGVTPQEAARQLMDAAESADAYRGYFPTREPTQWAGPFAYRYYPGTRIYLGVVVAATGSYEVGAIYVVGGPFGGSIDSPVPQGFVTNYITPVAPAPAGAGNGCFDLALARTAGTRIVVDYGVTGAMTGSMRIDTLVGSPTTFEGQQALLTTVRTTGSGSTAQGSATMDTTMKLYSSLAGTADVTQYGQEFVTTAESMGYTLTTTNRTVWNPPYLDPQYTLALGQSATSTLSGMLTSVMTGIAGMPAVPTTTTPISQTASTRYAGRETVTVPAGTFDTCRFEVTTSGSAGSSTVSNWVIFGKGIPVRTTAADQTTSATAIAVNGQPL